jgi:hypothetical protein
VTHAQATGVAVGAEARGDGTDASADASADATADTGADTGRDVADPNAPLTDELPHARAEGPDVTRLDVERLPPEAIDVTRDMYALGFFLQAELGGRGFAQGIGRISDPGFLLRASAGYELTSWFSVATVIALSFHETDAPAPPSATTFQVYDVAAQLRLQLPLSTRAALFLAGEAGLAWASGDFLPAWGVEDADEVALSYGGSLGFDWHLMNPHHSLGMRAGAKLYPGFETLEGEISLGLEGVVYLKYVF